MKKSKKGFDRRKKGTLKHTTMKKRKAEQKNEIVNKKALFNRYKNQQKVEEVLQKKKLMEQKLHHMQVEYSESEEEEDVFDKLVSCFGGSSKQKAVIESDEDTDSDVEEDKTSNKEHNLHSDGENSEQSDDDTNYDSSDLENEVNVCSLYR